MKHAFLCAVWFSITDQNTIQQYIIANIFHLTQTFSFILYDLQISIFILFFQLRESVNSPETQVFQVSIQPPIQWLQWLSQNLFLLTLQVIFSEVLLYHSRNRTDQKSSFFFSARLTTKRKIIYNFSLLESSQL